MKKAVVIGGAGFIGSHLIDGLLNNKYNVKAIDNNSSANASNIKQLIDRKVIEYRQGSILDSQFLQDQIAGSDYVFHLAAITNIDALKNPVEYFETNTSALLNVLRASQLKNVNKVIFASSSAIYGNEPIVPKREDMLPSPESPYASVKLIGEQYCQIFTKVYGLPTVYLRYFNVYGPRQNPDSPLASVIPRFIRNIQNGQSPIIYGDGEQTRDFVFVKDVVNATILAAESDSIGSYNVGSGESVSINELADLIISFYGNNVRPQYKTGVNKEIRQSLADISKAQVFGYKPIYNVKEGLKEMIKNSNTA